MLQLKLYTHKINIHKSTDTQTVTTAEEEMPYCSASNARLQKSHAPTCLYRPATLELNAIAILKYETRITDQTPESPKQKRLPTLACK